MRSSSKVNNPTFQTLIGSQEPTPEVLVPVINLIARICFAMILFVVLFSSGLLDQTEATHGL